MASNPRELSKQLNQPTHAIWVNHPEKGWKLWGGNDSDDIKTIDVEGIKAKGYNDVRLVPNGENWDYNDKTFDNYGLITEKGRSQLKDFLANKNLTTKQIMKLNNADFNNLAKEVQQKYGIDDFDLAQEFLVSEL